MNCTDFRVHEESMGFGQMGVQVFDVMTPDAIGRMAFDLLRAWGPVIAAQDGEDSVGRARVRPLTAAETVAKAFDIAEEAYAVASARGRLLSLPSLKDVNAQHDAKLAAKRSEKTAA